MSRNIRKIPSSIIIQISVFLTGLLSCYLSSGQQSLKNSYAFDYTFVNHLIKNENYNEAIILIDEWQNLATVKSFADTANYLKGMIYYRQKMLEKSAGSLLKVSSASENYVVSQFLSGYEYAHLGNYALSESIYSGINSDSSLFIELKAFQQASLSLLKHKEEDFEHYRNKVSNNYFYFNDNLIKLDDLNKRYIDFNQKSYVLAGVMSSIIPGSGKIYAGKLGEGVSTMLGLTVLGFITRENYIKAGPTNYKTILFGSLTGLLYVSNIYGSVVSVKVYRDEFYESLHHAVLFNMHIPIRSIFKSKFN